MISAYSLGKLADLTELMDFVAGSADAHLNSGNQKIGQELEQIVTKLNELRHQRLTAIQLTPEEQALVLDNKNIQAIKLVKERVICGLKEAKDIVIAWRDQNVSRGRVVQFPKDD